MTLRCERRGRPPAGIKRRNFNFNCRISNRGIGLENVPTVKTLMTASALTPDDRPLTGASAKNADGTEDPTTPKGIAVTPDVVAQNDVSSSLLMPPPTSTVRPGATSISSLAPSISTLPPTRRPRQKVILAPGHSPLDWALLKSSGKDLRVRALPPTRVDE